MKEIPEEFQEWTLDNLPSDSNNVDAVNAAKDYVENLEAMESSGINIVLSGPVGTGKSSLAWALGLAIVDSPLVGRVKQRVTTFQRLSGRPPMAINQVVLRSWTEVCEDCKRDWKRTAKQWPLDRLLGVQFLVLDDLGIDITLDKHGQGFLFQVIDARYKRRLPTIVTTNLPVCAAAPCGIDVRTVDRLMQRERCLARVLTGPSRRQRA